MNIVLPPDNDAKFVMAPMIDMVFLLLVFFMCASHLSTVQSVELEIPVAGKAVVPKERPDRLTVNITADGRLFGGNTEVTLDALKALVTEYKARVPDVTIYLRADRNAPHKHVRRVMNAMGELGIDDFIFGAFIPGES
ncbi:MAG: biopolymer transporter ExbD [Lentisphaerae bacterium]|nr:biopolymer transporter ExbD [Lentisphaerota bacterium]